MEEQLDLFEEEILRQKIPKILRVPRNWDIRKKDLSGLDYLYLENFFYGWYNIDMATEMFDVLNASEIAAKFIGVGDLKRYNAHLNYPDLSRENSFLHLVKQIDREAYRRAWANASRNWKKRFETQPMEQQKRLEILDDSVKQRFVDSFFGNYLPSSREVLEGNHFYDPNCDGRSKTVYANWLYDFITKKYSEAHNQ